MSSQRLTVAINGIRGPYELWRRRPMQQVTSTNCQLSNWQCEQTLIHGGMFNTDIADLSRVRTTSSTAYVSPIMFQSWPSNSESKKKFYTYHNEHIQLQCPPWPGLSGPCKYTLNLGNSCPIKKWAWQRNQGGEDKHGLESGYIARNIVFRSQASSTLQSN